MVGETINLRRRRKRAAREGARREADASAALFGRTRAERALEEARAEKAARDHAAHRREPDDG